MTKWTDEEKTAIGTLRTMWDRIEQGTGSCVWLDEYAKSEIREALKGCRYHINSGNTNPRPLELYHNMSRILNMEDQEGQYRSLLASFIQIEEADNRFIRNTLNAVAEQKIQEMEIASLLLVNRLFTQSCRMQIYGMKDLLLTQEQINNFDRAMDVKEIMEAERKKLQD